jgi:hypothetical protein
MNKNENESTLVRLTIVVALAVIVLACCSGCTTAVPVTAKFPDSPGKGAMEACPDLKKLSDGAKLSGVANTVADNYETYYGCAVKTDTWIEWYQIQKNIFEKAGK